MNHRISYHIKSCFVIYVDGTEQQPLASTVRTVNVSAVSGSAVRLNCTLQPACFIHNVRWTHYPLSSDTVIWYSGQAVHSSLESTGVTVESNSTLGWSVLIIPRVKPADRGRFHCHVTISERCQMNFQLTVTGNIIRQADVSQDCLKLYCCTFF